MSVAARPNLEPIAGYRLIERLGRGGFGEVWKAEAPGGLQKAIKFVYGDLSATGDGEPAEQELKSLERVKTIRHPFILSLERYDIVDGQLLIVMELADRNLWDRFRECRAAGLPGVPRDELLGYLSEAAEALDLMNIQYQLQHLDIKPQNLFLVYNHVKIADFGLVKDFEGKRGTITGGVTPVYAAPETFDGWVSRHSDQYSLAIVFQELLTGQRPFKGTTAGQLLLQHIQSPPELEALPEGDRPLVARALSKRPDDRFPNCMDFIRGLVRSSGRNTVIVGSAAVIETPPPSVVQTALTRPVGFGEGRRSGALRVTPRGSTAPSSVSRLAYSPTGPATCRNTLPAAGLASQTGTLFPVVVIGVGGAGGEIVGRLHRALRRRFGPAALPHLRLLAVDTDAAALRQLSDGAPDGLAPTEVFHAALNRPSYYLRGEGPAGVEAWLGASTLYKLPRNPGPAGHRAFGRLAFCDHAARLARHLRAELDACSAPAALAAAAEATGLDIRSQQPRVYVVASLAGGTGSGMFLDVAYLARAVLRDVGELSPRVNGVFLVPDDADAAGPSPANTYAALSELEYFSGANTSYRSTLSAKSPTAVDSGPPFETCLVLPSADKPDAPDATAAESAGAWLMHELLTPVGRAAEYERKVLDPTVPALVSAAHYRLTCPVDLLRRQSACRLARQVVRRWLSKETSPELRAALPDAVEEQWQLRGLHPERLAERLNEIIVEVAERPVVNRVEEIVEAITAPGPRSATAAVRASTAFERLLKLMGPVPGFRPNAPVTGAVPDAFDAEAPGLATACEGQVAELVVALIEKPGWRMVAAEELVRIVCDRSRTLFQSYASISQSLLQEALTQFQEVLSIVTGFERRGIQWQKGARLRELQDAIRVYAKTHYQGQLARCLERIYRGIVSASPEYLRDAQYCRDRLAGVAAELDERMGAALPSSDSGRTVRNLLPGGRNSVGEAAAEVVAGFGPAEWHEFERLVQDQVEQRFGSLIEFCMDTGPTPAQFGDVLVAVAEEFLRPRFAYADPAEALLTEAQTSEAVNEVLADAADASRPPLGAKPGKSVTVLAVPDSPAGRRVRELADVVLTGLSPLDVPARDEIVLYQEGRIPSVAHLPQFDPPAREAYLKALAADAVPPHCRFDIAWPSVKNPGAVG
jgi:hypothetical protein